jgi:hypothetical protein
MRRLAEELYPRADSVSTLLSHLEPLRVLAERRLPADSSLPGHIFKPTKPGGGGKLAHVHLDLRDQGLSRSTVDARDCVEEFDLLRERGAFPRSISTLRSPMDSSR